MIVKTPCKSVQEINLKTSADIFKYCRKENNVSLRNVERFTGISNGLISQIETGKIRNP